MIRDVGEVRAAGFPVFGRGTVPIPGAKKAVLPLNERVRCGGVAVDAGDVVVADEDGVVVVPGARRAEVLAGALARLVQEGDESLDEWEAAHRARVEELLRAGGFEG